MIDSVRKLWQRDAGQDIAEYAIMLAVVVALALGTVQAIGANANTVFSSVGSTIQ